MGLVPLHSGYLVHARKVPNRPFLTAISEPQRSHFSSVLGGSTMMSSPSYPRLNSLVFLHSGYFWQAMNWPFLPHLMTIGPPHFSQVKGVGISSRLTSRMLVSARARSFLNGS